MAGDTRGLYIADGCQIHRIDADNRVSLFTTMPGHEGHITQMLAAANHVLLQQDRPAGDTESTPAAALGHGCKPTGEATLPGTTLYAANRSTGVLKPLLTHGTSEITLLGTVGDEAHVEIEREADYSSDVLRYDLNSGNATPIAQHVDMLNYGTIGTRHSGLDDTSIRRHQLMWCKLTNKDSGFCKPGDEIFSYLIGADREVSLGKMPSVQDKLSGLTPDTYVSAYIHSAWWTELFANNPGTLQLSIYTYDFDEQIQTHLTLPWLVTPGVANSLREIPGSLPDMP